jgi:hypothetical protein
MFEELQKQQTRVADAFGEVLKTYKVEGVKEIRFDGSYFNIGFTTKDLAEQALKSCNILKYYQYEKIKGLKYPHRLLGAA